MQAQRGHRGCTSTGTDARVGSAVGARVRHVIDRGEGAQSARHLILALVSEGKYTQGYHKEQREGVHGTVRGEGTEESR